MPAKKKVAAKKASRKNGNGGTRREWTKDDVKALKAHSKAKSNVEDIAKETGRTVGALRQRAQKMGVSLGHRR